MAGGGEASGGTPLGRDWRRIKQAVLANVNADSPVMQEEIYGPLLPMMTYGTIDEAIAFVNEREKPLVSYIFSRARRVVDEFIARTSAGATVVNHTLIHFYQLNLPFGGAGQSGFGKGPGFFGFQSFSNARGVLDQRTRFSPIELTFPPYTRLTQKLTDLKLKYF